MNGLAVVLFLLIDSVVCLLMCLILTDDGIIITAVFVIRTFSLTLIALVLYLFSRLAIRSGLRPSLLYLPAYILGYLMIALMVFMVKTSNLSFFETFIGLHTSRLFFIVYMPFLATSPLLFLLNRAVKVIDWSRSYAERPRT